jgi:iron(III) transport system substrate-binding protein
MVTPHARIARAILTAIGVASSCCGFTAAASAQQGPVTVYCSAIAEWCETMRKSFETTTGIKALMTVKSAGETLAQIRAEKDNPRGDIWWAGGGDQHLQAAELGLTETYKSPGLAKLHPWAARQAEISGFRTVGIYSGTLGIVWNTEALAKRKLPEPKCWADLLDPAYKGELQMSNAASSGTSYAFLATLVQIMGEEKAFDYLKKLHLNINQYPRSGAAPMRNVATAETTLAITWMFAAVSEAQAGFPVKTIAPCEGTGYEIGSMSIIKGGRNFDGAKAWYEHVLTPAAQATGAKSNSFQIPSHVDAPLPPNTPLLGDVKLIDYDFAKWGSSVARSALVGRWEREIASAPR